MEAKELEQLRAELAEFLGVMTGGMGRMERCRAMQSYVTGLLLDGERKSIQPMAARLVQEPSEAEAMRQRLQECITISDWNEDEVWSRLALHVAAKMPELEAFVLDDRGFPKKGEHSVGVARQYSGTLGRVDNCQVATSLHLAGEAGSACIGMRLYLPEGWAKNEERRAKAGVPEEVEFRAHAQQLRPPEPIQELRVLTRARKQLVREKASHVHRLEKTLEDANLKICTVLSDIMGTSGRAMLDAIVAGETDPEQLAQLANKRVRATRAALAEAQRRTCNTSSSWGSTVT